MNTAQKFLLDNNCGDLILSHPDKPKIYASDIMEQYAAQFGGRAENVVIASERLSANGAVAEALNRVKVIAEKQRLYHLNIRNKNKRQETPIERIEYSDSKSSQSAYEYMLDEINKELTKLATASL